MKRANIFYMLFVAALVLILTAGIALGIKGQEEWDILINDTDLSAPVLSAESGFYDNPFSLSITSPDNVSIYYTLDGSIPTSDSILYTEPIAISRRGDGENDNIHIQNMQEEWQEAYGEDHTILATVVRAVAIDSRNTCSDIVTATYFVDRDEDRGKLVVSLVADPDDLFGDSGIYVTGKAYDDWYLGEQSGNIPMPNFLQHGMDWERPAVLELFESDSILQQPVGIRIQGASAREYGLKRFSVYSRKKYSGSNWFDIPLFGDWKTHSFALRSGFMNAYIQHLVQDRNIASAESREVVVYLNGAYWYATFAQEKYSGKFFQEQYGVDDDNVIIVKGGGVDSGSAEDHALYFAVYDFLDTHDMSTPEAYQELNRLIDIQSYIDFSCVNIYFGNLDYNENKNSVCWRARKPGSGEYEDGRWRWALYDLDLENLNYGVLEEDINTFTMDTHYAGSAFNTRPLWAALFQNSTFRRQFVVSFMDMVNTDFTVQNAVKAYENWDVSLPWDVRTPEWALHYFPARTESITGYLAEEFGLTGTQASVTLSVSDAEAGHILLNTIVPDLSEGEWKGTYVTDYPITVTAVPDKGYTFAGWQSNLAEELTEKTLTLDIPPEGLQLKAFFEKK